MKTATNSSSSNSASITTASSSSSAAAALSVTSSKPTVILPSTPVISSSRGRRIVGGGQQHPQQQQQHLRSHSSAYKQYYISNNSRSSTSGVNRQQRSSSYAWLRNPFVVFFMSFLAIGSVRFRVRQFHKHSPPIVINNNNIKASTRISQKLQNLNKATRTVVASALETNNKKKKINHPRSSVAAMTTPAASSKTPPIVQIEYVLVEEGKGHEGGHMFQRFAAQEKITKRAVSVQEWTTAMLGMNNNMGEWIRILKNSPFPAYFFETKGVTAINASKKSFEFVLVEAPDLHEFATQTARRAAANVAAAEKKASLSSTSSLLLAAQVPFVDQFASKQCLSSSSASSDDMGCVFENLGGDATLIAPKPLFNDTIATDAIATDSIAKRSSHDEDQYTRYSHLAAFCRGASPAQVESVLHMAVAAYAQRLGVNPPNNNAIKSTAASTKPVWFSTSGLGVAWLHFRLDSRPKYYTYGPFAKEQ